MAVYFWHCGIAQIANGLEPKGGPQKCTRWLSFCVGRRDPIHQSRVCFWGNEFDIRFELPPIAAPFQKHMNHPNQPWEFSGEIRGRFRGFVIFRQHGCHPVNRPSWKRKFHLVKLNCWPPEFWRSDDFESGCLLWWGSLLPLVLYVHVWYILEIFKSEWTGIPFLFLCIAGIAAHKRYTQFGSPFFRYPR